MIRWIRKRRAERRWRVWSPWRVDFARKTIMGGLAYGDWNYYGDGCTREEWHHLLDVVEQQVETARRYG